jgi:hypothetical protein
MTQVYLLAGRRRLSIGAGAPAAKSRAVESELDVVQM